jgi:hypothetical protein
MGREEVEGRDVRTGHSGLRPPQSRHCGRLRRAGQPAHQRASAVQRRAQPGTARDPAEPSDRRAVTGFPEVGADPVLVQ